MSTYELIEAGMTIDALTSAGETQNVGVSYVTSDVVAPYELTDVERAYIGETNDGRHFVHFQWRSDGPAEGTTLVFDTKQQLAEFLWDEPFDGMNLRLLMSLGMLQLKEQDPSAAG